MNEDADQLRQYAKEGSQDAFAGVVQKYLPLVYRAALRRVYGDVHRAEDVTQLVFIALARNAAALRRHPDLTGWLYTTTRFLAAKSLRTEQRRQSREQEAFLMQSATGQNPAPDDDAPLQAVLDDVMMELKQLDRQVLLLRFHRGLRLAEIGARLNVTENAVQKRVDRALDQLKERLGRRGVTSTATALAVALEQQTAVAVPAGLAAVSMSAALTCGTGGAGAIGFSSLMAISKLQVGLTATALLAATGGLVWIRQENTHLRAELNRQAVATATNAVALRQQISGEANRATASAKDLTSLGQAAPRPTPAPAPRTALQVNQEMTAYMNTVRQRGSQMQSEGRLQEALELYLETYHDFRDTRDTSGRAPPGANSQMQSVMAQLANLGKTFPAALTALRGLRDTAENDMAAAPANRDLGAEFAELNMHLKEDARTVALFDSLPPDDVRKQTLASIGYDQLVQARRYRDALIGKSFPSMLSFVDMVARSSPGQSADGRRADLGFLVGNAVKDIEVLTGAGMPEEARMLTEKLLAVADSESTRARIQQAIARATPAPTP